MDHGRMRFMRLISRVVQPISISLNVFNFWECEEELFKAARIVKGIEMVSLFRNWHSFIITNKIELLQAVLKKLKSLGVCATRRLLVDFTVIFSNSGVLGGDVRPTGICLGDARTAGFSFSVPRVWALASSPDVSIVVQGFCIARNNSSCSLFNFT